MGGWSPCSSQPAPCVFRSGTKPFLENSLVSRRRYTTTLKRIVPVTPGRSLGLQDNTGQIIPRFPHNMIVSLLYVLFRRSMNARSTGWLGGSNASRARSHREDAPINSLCRPKGKRLPKRENGRKVLVLSLGSHLTRAAIISDQQPHVSCQLLPALDAARLSCRLAVRWLLLRCTCTSALTAGPGAGADWLLCHCCMYACLSLSLSHCAVHICKWPPSCGIVTNPSCTAWLGCCCCCCAGWLMGWMSKKMQAVFVISLTRSWSARDRQG